MNNNQKWLSLLGLAMRARKVISGEELTLKEVRKGSAKLVLISADASQNTKKKFVDKCTYYNVPLVEVENRYVLGEAIGKDERVIVAIIDNGFAKKLQSLM